MIKLVENKFVSQYMGKDRVFTLDKPFEIRDNIAIIRVYGVLDDYPSIFSHTSYSNIFHFIDKIKQDNSVKGTAFIIDSPGGTVYKNSEMFDAIASLNNTVALVDNCCCSAGYWLASACDKIVATSDLAHFGSIGVLTQGNIGEDNTIVITNRKSPNKHRNLRKKEDVSRIKDMLDNLYSYFLGDISKKRIIDNKAVDGSVFLSKEALELGLIDAIDTNFDIQSYFSNLDKEVKMSNEELIQSMKDIVQASMSSVQEEIKSIQNNIVAMQSSTDALKKENEELKAKIDEQATVIKEQEEKAKAQVSEPVKDDNEPTKDNTVDDNTALELAKRNTVAVQPNLNTEDKDPIVEAVLKEGYEFGYLKERVK